MQEELITLQELKNAPASGCYWDFDAHFAPC